MRSHKSPFSCNSELQDPIMLTRLGCGLTWLINLISARRSMISLEFPVSLIDLIATGVVEALSNNPNTVPLKTLPKLPMQNIKGQRKLR